MDDLFYVAIGALFACYYTMKTRANFHDFEEYILIILGYIVSLFWYWSCKGYYYWNINFITLVNYYEKDILKFDKNERVYFIFANKETQNDYLSPISGANVSTSKVAILFAFTITLMWGTLLSYNLLGQLTCLEKWMWTNILLSFIISGLLIFVLSYLVPKKLLKSKIDHFPDLNIKQ
ncbi:MAG: hypothetical protein ACOCP4_03670 [Candidatus Woesearchaeota archaeon]